MYGQSPCRGACERRHGLPMWFFRRVLDDELMDFLLERLDSAGMEELDGHEPLGLAIDRDLPMPNWDPPYGFVTGCGACSREPVPYGDGLLRCHESLIEPWPCPHVRSLAQPFAGDAGYRGPFSVSPRHESRVRPPCVDASARWRPDRAVSTAWGAKTRSLPLDLARRDVGQGLPAEDGYRTAVRSC